MPDDASLIPAERIEMRPYVALILNDRRALGEFQPRKIDDTPDGSPLAGSLPAVVTEEEFQLARAGQEKRRDSHTVLRQGKHVNVFKGMLTHARDGEGFMLHNKGKSAKPDTAVGQPKGQRRPGTLLHIPL